MEKKKVILIILDGWGKGPDPEVSAVAQAHTPFVDSLYEKYPHSELLTYGQNVGLPEGQMGNSEVGHMNIGGGRVVLQELLKINKAIENGELAENEILLKALKHARENNKPVHLIGLVSDGGVHSSIGHLEALCDIARQNEVKDIFIHAFTDGRDTDPKSGIGFISDLQEFLKGSAGEIASVIGRYYAMDRDKRWERVKQAYDLLTEGKGKKAADLKQAIRESYNDGVTDEFIKPIVKVDDNGDPVARIRESDVVICFNFRTDRCREITMVLTQKDFPGHDMHPLNLYYVTMTEYDITFKDVHIIFKNENVKMTLGEVLAKNKKKQIRIAETEKYPHVTFFFSGGREEPFEGEKRIMAPSPKVATYDMQPEMSAYEVTDKIIPEIEKEAADFICLNFANPDMVGHTGVFEAAVKAVETVDKCTKRIVEAGLAHGYDFLITADHGNADYMINPDGSPNTAHTKNPVPLFYVSKDAGKYKVRNGKLGDLAPTILKLMEIDIPEEMTGEILLEERNA